MFIYLFFLFTFFVIGVLAVLYAWEGEKWIALLTVRFEQTQHAAFRCGCAWAGPVDRYITGLGLRQVRLSVKKNL